MADALERRRRRISDLSCADAVLACDVTPADVTTLAGSGNVPTETRHVRHRDNRLENNIEYAITETSGQKRNVALTSVRSKHILLAVNNGIVDRRTQSGSWFMLYVLSRSVKRNFSFQL